MSQVCLTCQAPSRIQIDRAILSGTPIAKICRDYGLSYHSVSLHAKQHLSRQLVTAFEKKQQIEDFNLLQRIDDLLQKTEKIFDRNFSKGHDNLAIKALAEQRQIFDMLARISFALHEAKRLEHEEEVEDDIHAQEEELSEALKILTLEELEVYYLIAQKVQTQDPNIEAVPPKKQLSTIKKKPKKENPPEREEIKTKEFLRTKWHI